MTSSPAALGLDFGGTKIAIAACDLAGNRLGLATVDSHAGDGAQAALDRGIAAAHALMSSLEPGWHLAGVGAATFGIPYDDRVELAPTIPGWEGLPFGRALREAFPGVPLALATDVKAAAQAELRWGALIDCDPALYLNLGTGLAAAIVAGGDVVVGANRASGEIGYNLRSVDDVDVALADRKMLEDIVSGKAFAAAADAHFGRPSSAAELFEQSATDAGAADIVDTFVRELAMHVVNLAVAIDPVRIVVGGGMVRSWSYIGPGLQRALEAAVPFPPELVPAQFPFDAPLIGALAVGVEAVRRAQAAGGRSEGQLIDEEALA